MFSAKLFLVLCVDLTTRIRYLTPMDDEWFDLDGAVAYMRSKGVKITRKTLYSNVSRFNKPKSYKIGKALRFKRSDLDGWIASITKER
jgi:predicted DNA-binding transcriptional regulator AlpA